MTEKIFSFSSLSYFFECPRAFYYRYILGYTSHYDSVNSAFGKAVHHARSRLFQDVPLQEIFTELKQFYTEPPLSDVPANERFSYEHLCILLTEYTKRNSPSPYKLIHTEHPFKLPFPDTDWTLSGRIDALITLPDGTPALYELKTRSILGKPFDLSVNPSDQLTGYLWAARQLFPSLSNLSTIILDGIQTAHSKLSRNPDGCFATHTTYRTDAQISEWLTSTRSKLRLLDSLLASDLSDWPMNAPGGCSRWGGCFFRDVCTASLDIRLQILENNYQRKENPFDYQEDSQ